MSDEREHHFGGDWTETKLRVLEKYLHAYTTALKKYGNWSKIYIDAFAGTGYVSRTGQEGPQGELDFAELQEPDTAGLRDGSAKRALRNVPPFDKFVLIEKDPDRCNALKTLAAENPEKQIEVRSGDANQILREYCRGDWSGRRAVVFLDPYGMQVEWSTLEAIAKTQAMDLWLLFPLGQAVNRLLTQSAQIPDGWRRRLTVMFGTDQWFDAVYDRRTESDLFETETVELVKRPMLAIGEYFEERLNTIFRGGVAQSGVLRNSRGTPIYLLTFAAANPRARAVALRIANDLLEDLR